MLEYGHRRPPSASTIHTNSSFAVRLPFPIVTWYSCPCLNPHDVFPMSRPNIGVAYSSSIFTFFTLSQVCFSPGPFQYSETQRTRTNSPPPKNQDNARAHNLPPVRFSCVFRAFYADFHRKFSVNDPPRLYNAHASRARARISPACGSSCNNTPSRVNATTLTRIVCRRDNPTRHAVNSQLWPSI